MVLVMRAAAVDVSIPAGTNSDRPPVMRFVAAPNHPDASPLNAHRLASVNVRLSDQAMHDISRIILERAQLDLIADQIGDDQ